MTNPPVIHPGIERRLSNLPLAVDDTPWSATTPKVLVVDDQEVNRDVLGRRLKRRGYEIQEAAGGEQALAMIADGDFDLILLDVMMPGMSGLEVLTKLRKTHSRAELPVIMATARDQSSDVVDALELGANDYVTKPIDFAVIIARIETQLSLRHSVQQILHLERRISLRNAALESANSQLIEAAERARRELDLASRVQASLLPEVSPVLNGVRFAWLYKPCTELAGDALNICQLGPNHVSFFLLDVSGHGVAASLASVAATRALTPAGRDSMVMNSSNPDPTPPAEVLKRLDERFPFREETEQFITMFYGVLDTTTRKLTYASAGHPPAFRIDTAGKTTLLDHANVPIGLGGPYDQKTVDLAIGDRIIVYSDGVTEATDAQREEFGRQRLVDRFEATRQLPVADSVKDAEATLERWRIAVVDDVSIVAVEIQ